MLENASEEFLCSECGAAYKVVRLDPPHDATNRSVHCRCCGAALASHDGARALKYFLVATPKFKALRA
jgi:hypothetical protein